MPQQFTRQHNLITAAKQIVRLSVPVVGAQLVSAVNSFVAMLLVAKLGRTQLAAGALLTSIQMTLSFIGWSTLNSIGIETGRMFGAKNHNELGNILRQGWILGTLLGLILMPAFWYMGPILRLCGQSTQIVQLLTPYFHILTWSVLPGMWYVCFLQFVTGISKPNILLYISTISLALLLIPGYGLLFGKFGLPKLGMNGMAYANIFMYWATCLLGFGYLAVNKFCKNCCIFRLNKITDFHHLKTLFKIGYPISLQYAGELIAFSAATIIIGWLGITALAAQQIVVQLGFLIIITPYGIGQVSGILISQSLGKTDNHKVRYYGEAGMLLGLIFALMVAAIYYFFPDILIRCFSVQITSHANKELIGITRKLLIVVAVAQIFDSVKNVATGALRGFKDTQTPMWLGIIFSWLVSLPIGYALGFKLHLGVIGVRMGFVIGFLFCALLLIYRFYQRVNHVKTTSNLFRRSICVSN
ncbi:MAG: MATE family efflux transporter [Gammaproteobacteria bacterium]|nr:MATE family efflux transporter [Gammaproteobacteria bacterium]